MTTATRVFVSVSSKSSHYNSAWDSPDSIVRFALQVVKDSNLRSWDELPTPRFLAKERWQRIHIAFGIFNNTYDPQTAHLAGQNDLPVIAVYLTGKSANDDNNALMASASLEEEVNQTIRDLHNWHGNGSHPPFAVDHANNNVPTYPNPRTLIKAKAECLN